MINDDVLIKFARSRGYKENWPEQVVQMKRRMTKMKLGFPGIGNDHLSLVNFDRIQVDDIFIYDPYVENYWGPGDEAPLMLRALGNDTYYVEGIGCGVDSVRDPDRNLKWMDTIQIPREVLESTVVFRVNVRPTINGGPGYYYFFKAYRDARV